LPAIAARSAEGKAVFKAIGAVRPATRLTDSANQKSANQKHEQKHSAQRVVRKALGGLRLPFFTQRTPMRNIGYGWGHF